MMPLFFGYDFQECERNRGPLSKMILSIGMSLCSIKSYSFCIIVSVDGISVNSLVHMYRVVLSTITCR
jgi:hypothetical protein